MTNTKTIPFCKAVASGNDFVVVDNRKGLIKNEKKFAQKVCRPHLDIGADGVLLVEKSNKADFFMRIINSDGSEAETCGNGFRCITLYAHCVLGFPKKMKFETLAGMIDGEILSFSQNERPGDAGIWACMRAKMVNPKDYKKDIFLELEGIKKLLHCSFIDTGVPHAVIFTEGLESVAVHELGRKVRYHDRFMPRGTNVNFVEITGKSALSIRTYERGVEAETLACGSGSTAAAVIGCLTGHVQSPVKVKTKSGEILTVRMKIAGDKVRNVFLEGDAKIVFEGNILVEGDVK